MERCLLFLTWNGIERTVALCFSLLRGRRESRAWSSANQSQRNGLPHRDCNLRACAFACVCVTVVFQVSVCGGWCGCSKTSAWAEQHRDIVTTPPKFLALLHLLLAPNGCHCRSIRYCTSFKFQTNLMSSHASGTYPVASAPLSMKLQITPCSGWDVRSWRGSEHLRASRKPESWRMIRALAEAPTPGYGFTFPSPALVVGSGTRSLIHKQNSKPCYSCFRRYTIVVNRDSRGDHSNDFDIYNPKKQPGLIREEMPWFVSSEPNQIGDYINITKIFVTVHSLIAQSLMEFVTTN